MDRLCNFRSAFTALHQPELAESSIKFCKSPMPVVHGLVEYFLLSTVQRSFPKVMEHAKCMWLDASIGTVAASQVQAAWYLYSRALLANF
jgi:hypothetical protein